MTTWINQETGEVLEADCPRCAETRDEAETQVGAIEREIRKYRTKVTKLERAAERDEVKRRDGAVWKQILEAWREAFPGKKVRSTDIKSARATKVFLRLERGASIEDCLDAIEGARQFPYVVFGKRQKSGSRSDLADDLEHIMAVNRDHEFDFLADVGRKAREEW